jgi:glycosyltransferase involved in cell wall biosynthesis
VSETAEAFARRLPERLAAVARVAIVPALNEAGTVGRVIDEIGAVDPDFRVVVVDDGSSDRTAAVAASRGASVVRLPFNLGIGGAVQTGYRYALENGFDIAVQIDGDGQHDPSELHKLLAPLLEHRADLAVGSRFRGDRLYRAPLARRLGIRVLAGIVSLMVGQRVTDPTSGFRAVNRRGICLFATDYPHDYPEVEATVLVHRNRMTMVEVPVAMRNRAGGRSSITGLASLYYMVKVILALFVGLFRRYPTPMEEQ